MTFVLAVLFGVAIGLSLGLLGAGGSILAVPVLVYALGEPVTSAVPTSLLVVGGAAAGGALSHLRAGRILWRTVALFGITGVGGSYLGALVNRALDERVVLLGFAALMLVAAAGMLRRAMAGAPQMDGGRADDDLWRRRRPLVLTTGLVVGFLTGLFGVGGGFILVPALTLVLDIPLRVAVGSSLVIVVVNSLAGFVFNVGYGSIDWTIAAAFTIAGVCGAVAGGRLSERFDGAQLTRWFAYLVLAIALFVILEVLMLDTQGLS